MFSLHNLIQDPKPTSTNGWQIFGGGSTQVELRMTSDSKKLFVRNITGGGAKGVSKAMKLTAGRYVWGVYLETSTGYATGNQFMLVKDGDKYHADVRYSGNAKYYLAPFELNGHDDIELLLVPPPVVDGRMNTQYFLLASEGDAEVVEQFHKQGYLEHPWFDGDTGMTLSLGEGA